MTVTKVIIQQGPPGSGKSYNAEQWSKQYACMTVCSNDHFHMVGGVYQWRADKQEWAHQECFKKFIQSLMWRQHDLIVVDNANIMLWEMSPYIRVAQAFNCFVELHTYKCPVEVCFKRNQHNVPYETIERMARDMETPPKYWGVKHIVHEYRVPGLPIVENKAEPYRYGDGVEVPKDED